MILSQRLDLLLCVCTFLNSFTLSHEAATFGKRVTIIIIRCLFVQSLALTAEYVLAATW